MEGQPEDNESHGAVAREKSKWLPMFKRHADIIISNIRFEGSLLAQLCLRNVITKIQMIELDSISSRIKKAEALISYVRRGDKYSKIETFAEVLRESEQNHISALILKEDASDICSEEMKRATLPKISESIKALMRKDVNGNIHKLQDLGIITAAQSETIRKTVTRHRAQLLLDIIQCRPLTAIKKLQQCINGDQFVKDDILPSPCIQSNPVVGSRIVHRGMRTASPGPGILNSAEKENIKIYKEGDCLLDGYVIIGPELKKVDKSNPTAETSAHGDDVLLDKDTRHHITANLDYLTKNLDTENILQKLCQLKGLTPEQKDNILAEPTPGRQAAVLLDIILRGSRFQYKKLLETLEGSNQNEVLTVIKTRAPIGQGAIAKVMSKWMPILKRHEDCLISNIRFEGSFLVHLVSGGVITEIQMHDLNALPNRFKKAEALLAYVKRGGNDTRIEKFAEGLRKTDQGHLCSLIFEEDGSNIFSETNRKDMRLQMIRYINGIMASGALGNLRQLETLGVLTSAQREAVQQKATTHDRAELLLDIMQCRPLRAIQNLQKCIDSGQFTKKVPINGAQSQQIAASRTENRNNSARNPVNLLCKKNAAMKAHLERNSNIDKSGRDTYHEDLKDYQKKACQNSNQRIQKEFGLNIGRAVFFITLLVVPRHIQTHGHNPVRQLFEQQHELYVEMPNLFDAEKKGPRPHRVLILGAAGSGKSTLVQHSCEQWALGFLWKQFRYVFNLTCRHLKQMVENNVKISMFDLLLQHGPIITKYDPKIARNIFSCKQSILIVVDGVDELSSWIDFSPENMLPKQDIYEPAGILELIHSLMIGQLMAGSSVLVTSRPIDRIDIDGFDKTVRIFGFGRHSIENCILALAEKNNDKKKAVLEYLDHRPQLYMFCTLPLGCIMTGRVVLDELSQCFQDQKQEETINCATLLYIYVLLVFLSRRMKQTTHIKDRFEGVYVWCKTLLKMMALAAWGMFQTSPHIIFSSQTMREHAIDVNDLPCGLLDINPQTTGVTQDHTDATGAFIHYSIQEFLTALHVAVTWKSADIKLITNRTASHQFNMVLLYLSGLLGNPLGNNLIQAIDKTITTDTLNKRLIKLFNGLFVMYEGRFWFLPTLTKKGKDSSKLMRLQLIRCTAEGNHGNLVQKIDETVLTSGVLDLTEMPGGLLPEHMPAIAFYLQWSEAVTSLKLEPNYCSNLIKVKNPENEERLVSMLDTSLLQSGHLDLRGWQLSNEDIPGLVTYVLTTRSLQTIEKHTAIQLMRGITPENHAGLAPLLDRSVLEKWFDDIGIERCGKLYLHGTDLTEDDVRALALFVRHSRSLTNLDLPLTAITDTGAQSLASALKHNRSLYILNLTGNNITDKGATSLASVLRVNQTLKHIYLLRNQLSPDKMSTLRDQFGIRIYVYEFPT